MGNTNTYSKTNTEKVIENSDDVNIYSELMGDNFKNKIKVLKNKFARIEYDKPHVLTGKDFKIKFNSENKFFVRYMNDSMNEDTGLYFTTIDYVQNFAPYSKYHIRFVEIPDDAQVRVVPLCDKWKADKIIIGEKISLDFFKVYQTVKNIEGFFD
jgi:hypothetical protein